jgi:serine/threonine protein kinase
MAAAEHIQSGMDPIETGKEIDGFLVGEKRHAGATADLFSATPVSRPDPGFPILLKAPKVGAGQPTESILGYEMEAMILPTLTGPHVPRFVAAGALTATPFLAMEQIEGRSLSAVATPLPLPPMQVAELGAAIADALHHLHRQNAIHHDLKPDNVIVRPDGRAVLIDFGFARHADYPDLLAEERRHTAGSVPYVSPEQISGVRSDSRSDIFALGALLYELATGELPFGIPETYAGLADRLWKIPPPPRALNAAVPPWLQEVILRCLEINADLRYQNAAHIAFDLRHSDDVQLTARAERLERTGPMTQLSRWWRSRAARQALRASSAAPSDAPIIMVAIDTSNPDDPRHPALQWATQQMASLNLEFRMICVSVIRAAPLGEGSKLTDTSSGLQLEHKVRLTHWVEPLGLPPHRLSLHVLESTDPAATLLKFATSNHVDLIVLGAPGPSEAALAWWRSVASTVTANAHCSVHVVRVPERPRPEWHASSAPVEATSPSDPATPP